MRRIGNSLALLGVLVASAALAETQFYASVDRNQVGTEDTFQLTVVVTDAPEGAQLKFPSSDDFEILQRSQSTQMSYHLGGGGAGVIQRVQKYVLVMRANRAGTLTLPSAVLNGGGRSWRTEPIRMEVKKGRTSPPPRRRDALPDPFRNLPLPGFPDDDLPDPFRGFPEPEIPRSDSDLFLKAYVDREEAYVGEQVTLSLYIFSRLDLSSVDNVTMPKLDGFWSEDLDSPTQLAAEQRTVGGVPYRAYLLRRRALFPVKPGSLVVEPAEADITTGMFFQGQRVHRKGNELEVKVKPLPPGAPAGFSAGNVGRWRLSTEATSTRVAVGEPLTVRVVVDGRGNAKNLTLPPLTGPSSLKIYDPTMSDRPTNTQGQLGGRRTFEYLVMPQQTGTFTLPGLALSYFDPQSGRYEESRTDPITVQVTPGAQGQHTVAAAGGGSGVVPDDSGKNKLEAGGLRTVRYRASFEPTREPLWRSPYFGPAAAAPVGLWALLWLGTFVRDRLRHEDEATRKRKKARAARARLATAEKRLKAGTPAEFYGEVEKALLHFFEAKLGMPVGGLLREQLAEKLQAAGLPDEARKKAVAVLEACDMGRFAPGAGSASRDQVLDLAEEAMEAWTQS